MQQLHAFYDKQVEAIEREAGGEGGGRSGTGTHGGIGTRGVTAPPLRMREARGVGRRGAEVEGRGGWGDGVDAEVRTGQRRRLRQMLERLDAMEIRAAQ